VESGKSLKNIIDYYVIGEFMREVKKREHKKVFALCRIGHCVVGKLHSENHSLVARLLAVVNNLVYKSTEGIRIFAWLSFLALSPFLTVAIVLSLPFPFNTIFVFLSALGFALLRR